MGNVVLGHIEVILLLQGLLIQIKASSGFELGGGENSTYISVTIDLIIYGKLICKYILQLIVIF